MYERLKLLTFSFSNFGTSNWLQLSNQKVFEGPIRKGRVPKEMFPELTVATFYLFDGQELLTDIIKPAQMCAKTSVTV